MNPLLVFLPFHRGDFPAALRLSEWIGELGGAHDFTVVALADHRVLNIELLRVTTALKAAFGEVFVERCKTGLETDRWPRGANAMFRRACQSIQERYRRPFLWLEPDCVPLRSGWLDTIAQDYTRHGKLFMGHIRTQTNTPELPATYLPGCSVYPANASTILSQHWGDVSIAWDVSTARITVPLAANSTAFFEWWGQKNEPPTFKAQRSASDPPNVLEPGMIPSDAVLFHRCKDGTLIGLLQGKVEPAVICETKPDFKIVHVAERHFPEDARVQRAVMSWQSIYKTDHVVPVHVDRYPRSSIDIGDNRGLPYLKDVLLLGMAAANSDDVVMITNGDNLLHPSLPKVVSETLAKVPCICSFRLNVRQPPAWNQSLEALSSSGKPDFGRDLFAFRKSWLCKHWSEIPDFFLGEWEWDLIMALMIRKENGVTIGHKHELNQRYSKSELPLGYVFHEMHERKWMRLDMLTMPAKVHNKELARDWYARNKRQEFYTLGE